MYRLYCQIACRIDPRNALPDLLEGLSDNDIDQIIACVFIDDEGLGGQWKRKSPTGLTLTERRQRRAFFAMSREDQNRYLDLLWVLEQAPLTLGSTPLALEYNQRHYS